jgi:quinohemoprotein amine dehydrogenase
MKRAALLLLVAPLLFAARPWASQQAPALPTASKAAPDDKPDEGYPVTSDVVKRKCSGCHHADDKGRLSRISFRRTTPEGWEQTIKRMISLNNLKIEPAEARDVLRYLADHQGLAPEEAEPAAFEVERRQIDFRYAGEKDDKDKKTTEETCIACHSFGRVMSQRRTKEEWELLVAMHRGYYWLSDFQAFRRAGPTRREPNAPERSQDNRHPMDVAISHLSSAFPLTTPEWSAWSATMRPPQLQGKWAISGYEMGKGPLYGQMTISSGPDAGEFTTEISYTIPSTGEQVKRTGKAIVYTGYQWRGRDAQADNTREFREVMFVDRDWRHAHGRWFTGAYDEFGIDVQIQRVGADPVLTGAATAILLAPASDAPARYEVRLFGANLPSTIAARDLNFGPGVAVERVVSAAADQVTVEVSVARGAAAGRRSVFLNGANGSATVAVADRVDFIKVAPQAGLARVGGANFPKQFQQFEAIAYANGPDGKPDTNDDVELGPVKASWTIEEYTATFDDDDKDFVGTIDAATGLFTPNLDGPNPKRRHNANNYGDVWVVASYAPTGGDAAKPLKARAHLLVTVPLYMKFEQPEVAR